ncbi:MAG: hypothetical protein AAGG51_27615 [Cyanobacteria bacterium P01_G01_bin.54]
MDVYIHGKRVALKPKNAIGKGGEADVFRWGQQQVIKCFKPPSHPDYAHSSAEQQGARLRLAEHQQKLRQFPSNVPKRAIAPQTLAYDQPGQQILGYAMPLVAGAEPLLRYSQPNFRKGRIGNGTVVAIFQDLHQTLLHLHRAGVVVGDFNDLNVLVKDTAAYLIDTDSWQFGSFLCRVFTAQTVDPLLCDSSANAPQLQQPYNANADWYAFTVLLMQCLLYVHPYGGIYKPRVGQPKVPQAARSLRRITVFNPAVKYPKPATPYAVLPDALLHHFQQVFEQDQRGVLPRLLLDQLTWHTCPSCGVEHARVACPLCQGVTVTVGQVPTVETVHGQVTAQAIVQTRGQILAATVDAKLRYLYYEAGEFKREDGTVVLTGQREPQMQYLLQGQTTIFAKDQQAIALMLEQAPERLAVDAYQTTAQIVSNGQRRYWLHNGQLLRDGPLGPDYIGDVLSGQTRIWVGPTFGLGYYRAGTLSVVFVFDALRPGLNDRIPLHLGAGQLLDANCVFSGDRGWFFWTLRSQGQTVHHCAVLQPNGQVLATDETVHGQSDWLMSLQGHCAVGQFLLVATDEGIVRVEVHQGQVMVVKRFPDTEPFVSRESGLLPASQGLYVVNAQGIGQLRLG